jgi:hypothetical protein
MKERKSKKAKSASGYKTECLVFREWVDFVLASRLTEPGLSDMSELLLFSLLLALPDHNLLNIFLGISSGPFEATLALFLSAVAASLVHQATRRTEGAGVPGRW